jgi:arginine decarboxylase
MLFVVNLARIYDKTPNSGMAKTYHDLIAQTFDFPQEGFKVVDDELYFNEIPLMEIIKKYGTPLKISYLPKISSQIQKAKRLFNVAMAKTDYKGTYTYCYCTKSSHFSFVLEEALKNDIHLETSSAFDIPIIRRLSEMGLISKDRYIVCNGFKRQHYAQLISELVNDGFSNTIPVIDSKDELRYYEKMIRKGCNIGIRIAADEEPDFEFYTSRLGIRQNEILEYYKQKIKGHQKFKLKMLHFFINTGIKDTAYYWNELTKCINVYCELKKECPELDSIDIGGGFPIKTSLAFQYDYEYMAEQIVETIKKICNENDVAEPHIFSEFGSFTVGESGAMLYSIIDQKRQNDKETWNLIDSSFITTLPDTWGIKQRFVLLAINHWNKPYQQVNLGGMTCDSDDFYISESHVNNIYLPELSKSEPLYVGFFHTGAYQESIGGYGGIQHCLIPAPKHVLIDLDEEGEITTRLFAKEQSYQSMLKILGYPTRGKKE